MRAIAYAFLLMSALPLACGGGTPEPKNEDEAVSSTKSEEAKPDEAAKTDESSAAPAGSAAAAAAPADSSAQAAAPSAKSDAPSGDVKTPDKDDPWMASHQMPPKDVDKTVKPQLAKVKACFKTAKKKDPSVTGEVKIRFVITNDGKVRDWKDDASSMTSEEVTSCVGEVVKKLKFPKQKSPGDAIGSYQINFTP
jgi:hypothetical protein